MLFIGMSASLCFFWWQYHGVIFQPPEPVFQMELQFSNYIALKRTGFWVEALLVLLMVYVSGLLWTKGLVRLAIKLVATCSLVSLTIGVIYLIEGFQSRIYAFDEQYSLVLMNIDISLVAVGVVCFIVNRFHMKAKLS